jgi:hypothetical protein
VSEQYTIHNRTTLNHLPKCPVGEAVGKKITNSNWSFVTTKSSTNIPLTLSKFGDQTRFVNSRSQP